MSELVDHLAGLTGTRDRDLIDVTLVQVFHDLLRPLACGVYRPVGEAGRQSWLTRAHLVGGETIARSDPAWADLDELPPLAAEPARCEALQRVEPVRTVLESGAHRCVFPVGSDHEVLAVLEIDTREPLDASSERIVCSILRIYRNFHSLLDYGERDMLTGLLNRKSFDDSFMKALADANAHRQEMAEDANPGRRDPRPGRHFLGVIDIDHFKSVNDRFGHLIGDEVLLLLSRLMRGSFRYRDQLYRFGGEEFVALVRCRDDAAARRVFERLRGNTESYPFPQVGHITVSVGYTELRPHDSPASAFERADRAVYFAKGNGRNQVCSHRALVERGDLADTAKVGGIELF
jgi:diguanylate cyclase (GGDEF)-like protein